MAYRVEARYGRLIPASALSAFDAAAIAIALAAVLGYLNHRSLGLPPSIGLTIMGAVASLLVIGIDRVLPSSTLAERLTASIAGIDFHTTMMEGMLSFLLFAGALHVDWTELRRGRWPILALSTVRVLLSTMIVGGGFHLLTRAAGIDVPLLWCFVFGALISPTDPVAVMGEIPSTSWAMPRATIRTVSRPRFVAAHRFLRSRSRRCPGPPCSRMDVRQHNFG